MGYFPHMHGIALQKAVDALSKRLGGGAQGRPAGLEYAPGAQIEVLYDPVE